jgi:hypothetical protein
MEDSLMIRLREELAVIPRAMWVITILGYVGFATLVVFVIAKEMPLVVRLVFGLGIPLIFSSVLLLTGYVYGDARRRNMQPLLWALLALLMPSAIGFILYFIMREPLMLTCTQCGKPVRGQFPFCPFCGASRSPSCPQCRAAVEAEWPHCPHCGTSLKWAG